MLAQGLLKVCLLVCPFAVFRPNSHVVAKLNQHMTYTDILLLGYPQVMLSDTSRHVPRAHEILIYCNRPQGKAKMTI